MRKFAFLIAAGTLFALPLPASAASSITDVSSQVAIDAGPVGVRVGEHRRWRSERRERRMERRCETRTVIRDTPRGRIRKTERICR